MKKSIFLIQNPKDKYPDSSTGRGNKHYRWEVDETKIYRSYKPEINIDNQIPLLEQLCDLEKLNKAEWFLKDSPLIRGQYYPRIYRPTESELLGRDESDTTPEHQTHHMVDSIGQLLSMTASLKEIFRVIAPTKDNLDVYGHEIRNLLIIACTEVETQWKGILRANSYIASSKYWTTADYIKLLAPLRLDSYAFVMPMYPQISSTIGICPFGSWDAEKPTKSLEWYDAYNSVKHDRENEFHKAKLKYVINAIVACAILFQAQYGQVPLWTEQAGSMFQKKMHPWWKIEDHYFGGGFHSQWSKVDYSFDEG